MKEMKVELEKLAKRKCRSDQEDFNAMEYSGGNFDDAYNEGIEDGETQLAQYLLSKFFT